MPGSVQPSTYRPGMRLLHTSDWHLGRSFHREDLLPAQAQFVDFLVETVRSERVDAVLVSGDVYDRALPPVDAVALFDDALRRLAATGTRVVLISGNHDSARRLGFGSGLIDAAGIHLRTDGRRRAPAGPARRRRRPGRRLRRALPRARRGARRARLRRAQPRRGPRRRDEPGPRRPGRPAGHPLGRAGPRVRDRRRAERERARHQRRWRPVGPAVGLRGVDYAALGHLHGAQRLSDRVRYSGSPLPYSFSEEHHTKQVLLVELGRRGRVARRPSSRCRRRCTGRWPGCPAGSTTCSPAALVGLPREPLPAGHARPTRCARASRWSGCARRFPHVLVLGFAPEGGPADDGSSYAARVRGRTDLEIGGRLRRARPAARPSRPRPTLLGGRVRRRARTAEAGR